MQFCPCSHSCVFVLIHGTMERFRSGRGATIRRWCRRVAGCGAAFAAWPREFAHVDGHVVLFEISRPRMCPSRLHGHDPAVEPNSSTVTSRCWCVFRESCSALPTWRLGYEADLLHQVAHCFEVLVVALALSRSRGARARRHRRDSLADGNAGKRDVGEFAEDSPRSRSSAVWS